MPEALEAAGILANRNAIPFDTKPPQITSGLRLGTPAMTTRGFGPAEIKQTVAFITRVLSDHTNQKLLAQVKEEVSSLCGRFPAPGID
jgi:glycine hydroxymethyltransferase